jgi:hypothetical protein
MGESFRVLAVGQMVLVNRSILGIAGGGCWWSELTGGTVKNQHRMGQAVESLGLSSMMGR